MSFARAEESPWLHSWRSLVTSDVGVGIWQEEILAKEPPSGQVDGPLCPVFSRSPSGPVFRTGLLVEGATAAGRTETAKAKLGAPLFCPSEGDDDGRLL